MSIILRILQDKYLCYTKIFDRTAFKKQFQFLKGNKMKTSDFYYDLPKELIAQTPLEPRDSSRLLVLDREKQTLEHKHFYAM